MIGKFSRLTQVSGRFQVFFRCFLVLFLLAIEVAASADKETTNSNNNENASSNGETKARTKVISLVESINRSQRNMQDPERAKASREQWERALKEIKELPSKASPSNPRGVGLFSQWKLLLDEPKKVQVDPETKQVTTAQTEPSELPITELGKNRRTPARFEGFASWDRLMQDWADDVQEYVDKIEAENTEYPMSTMGRPKSPAGESVKEECIDEKLVYEIPKEESVRKDHKDTIEAIETKAKKPISLPGPAPVKEGEEVLPHTDISDKSKNIWIVTTASLPWMTGTAVNPLLRAAYMVEGRGEAGGSVTLMVPWMERSIDQDSVYGKDRHFDSPEQQEAFIREWLRDKAKLPEASEQLKIEWYTAWQNKLEDSVYSMGDITALIPAEEVDIMILEEPEHLNWYRGPGESWTDKFKHVVGIIHTNYFVYAQDQPAAFIRAPGMKLLCSWMCRAHCHRVIKLSGTLGQFAPEKELVENVHGVRGSFLEAGEEVRKRLESPNAAKEPIFGAEAEPSVYFIGKMLWSKGLGSLIELLKYAEESAGIKIPVDMYGGGPDKEGAAERASLLGVDMKFRGPIDHGELAFTHKIFINPSTSEVLCTTVAEALAMGKFVLVPSHPSNDFFAQFPNCLTYTNKEEFVGDLYYALTHSPEPLTSEVAYALSWKAATKRLEAAGSIPVREAEMMAEALGSKDGRIEISLPSLIENGKSRELLATGLRRSRSRYRQFRSRLSQEIQHSNVLPNAVRQRLISELDKRLDLDIDEALESPKLRLQLSPAELDKRLLDFYETITKGPSGDIIRVIGAGCVSDVAFQDLYIKRRASRERSKNPTDRKLLTFGPFEGEEVDENARTASQWVKRALRRNLPKDTAPITDYKPNSKSVRLQSDETKSKTEMSLSLPRPVASRSARGVPTIPSTTAKQFCPPRKPSSFSLLI